MSVTHTQHLQLQLTEQMLFYLKVWKKENVVHGIKNRL